MPIYEYECGACGHRFEEWQKMSDAPVQVCPQCKKKKVERLISQTSFHLKGGGWYADLYSSSKGGGSKGGGGEKAESKSETKSTTSSSDSGSSSSSTTSSSTSSSKKASSK